MDRALPHEIRHEAIAVNKSAKLQNLAQEEVLRFLKKQLFDRSDKAAVTEVGLVELARQHILVEWFTNDLCATVRARRLLDTQIVIEPFEFSINERIRIHRALYRFQLYYNLFPPEKSQCVFDYDARDVFFARFPAWEVEEFACIHDYLHGRLDVMDEITLHDLQSLFLYQRISDDCENYEQRRVLFSDNIGTDYDGIPSVLESHYDVETLQPNVSQHQAHLKYAIGPNAAWLWSIESDTATEVNSYPLYYVRERADLREWCYCFWDDLKLNAWHTMDVARTDEPYQAWVSVRQAAWTRKHELYHQTYESRDDMSDRGASGYWTPSEPERYNNPEYEHIIKWRPQSPLPTRLK
ncbi:hypothetical protein MMC18_000161 [Xylographa bjoerkii]|nr:hypothetical protein [Xylographa bjoerkii]